MAEVANVYMHKNGRLMAYIKDTQQVVSYPRVIMENYLGRKLEDYEEVHHKDGNPLNNDIDNLEVLTKEEHLRLHSKDKRKYYDKIMTCPWCGNDFLWTADQQLRFNSNRHRDGRNSSVPFCSKKCAGEYGRKIQRENGYNIGSSKRKLTDEQVRYIRNNYVPRSKEFGKRALAKKFNIDYSTIGYVLSGKTYQDVV
jgi:hypothetical protein